jgi:hypothetical protein
MRSPLPAVPFEGGTLIHQKIQKLRKVRIHNSCKG